MVISDRTQRLINESIFQSYEDRYSNRTIFRSSFNYVGQILTYPLKFNNYHLIIPACFESRLTDFCTNQKYNNLHLSLPIERSDYIMDIGRINEIFYHYSDNKEFLTKLTYKNTLYYVGKGIILDSEYNVLICSAFDDTFSEYNNTLSDESFFLDYTFDKVYHKKFNNYNVYRDIKYLIINPQVYELARATKNHPADKLCKLIVDYIIPNYSRYDVIQPGQLITLIFSSIKLNPIFRNDLSGSFTEQRNSNSEDFNTKIKNILNIYTNKDAPTFFPF